MMEESAKLLTLQRELEKETDGKVAFIGLSVADTIMLCIQGGLHKRADKIRSEWKVTEKQCVPVISFLDIRLTSLDSGG
jgi:hypothetical protein